MRSRVCAERVLTRIRPRSPLGWRGQVPTKNVIRLAQPFFLELTHPTTRSDEALPGRDR
jgi:hypothetical protein